MIRHLMLLLLLRTATLMAQPVATEVKGHVKNEKGEPIEFATVILKRSSDSTLVKGTTTDLDGNFIIKDVDSYNYFLIVKYIGYQPATINHLQVQQQPLTLPAITLAEDKKLLEEVVVRGQRPLIEHDGEKLIMNVENTIIASGGTALEVLTRAPGVTIDQNDQLSLNGKQGVTIMINGKMSQLAPAQLSQMLQNMNSNDVEAIEIISNPGAGYDAAGNAGVINIRLKKSAWEGWNGSVLIGAGIGKYEKAQSTINLNYKSDKWSHFVTYNYNYNRRYFNTEFDRLNYRGEDPVYFDQLTNRILRQPFQNWQAGTEYQWNKKNLITLATSGSSNSRSANVITTTDISNQYRGIPDSTFTISNQQDYKWSQVTGTLGFRHQFNKPGNEWTMDLDYSTYRFRIRDNITVDQSITESQLKDSYRIISNQPSQFTILAFKSDYTQTLTKNTRLDMGIKASRVTTANEVRYDHNQTADDTFEKDVVRSNDFEYTEQITAAYANLRTTLFGFATQLGLRGENTEYEGVSRKEQKEIGRSYFQLFPSLSMNRTFKEYRLGISYSYRIDRPSYNSLYPFIFYMDPFSAQQGNPLLLPQFSHVMQISNTFFKKYIINIGYTNTRQYIGYIILLNPDRVSGYATQQNLDEFKNYSLSFTAPLSITKNWNMNVSLTGFYNQYDTEFLGQQNRYKAWSGNANITQTFTLPWGLTGEIATLYTAPNVVGFYNDKARGAINLGLQKPLMNNRAYLRINFTDILLTNQLNTRVTYPGLDIRMNNQLETRMVRATFTYNFGKNSQGPLRRRNTPEEEQRRINTNQ